MLQGTFAKGCLKVFFLRNNSFSPASWPLTAQQRVWGDLEGAVLLSVLDKRKTRDGDFWLGVMGRPLPSLGVFCVHTKREKCAASKRDMQEKNRLLQVGTFR